jgi:protein-disulfide isomerase
MNVPASDSLIPVGENDHVLGSEEPELTLIEYGDFGCPFCLAASRPVGSLLERYPSLNLVWRHFPDPDLHPGADLAAELSEIAADHGQFWEAHSQLLAGRERFTVDDLLSLARRLDLDPAEAESALGDRTYRDRVLEDVDGGERAGVHATPTFFLGGRRLEGHWRQLAQLVPAMLSEETPEGRGSGGG